MGNKKKIEVFLRSDRKTSFGGVVIPGSDPSSQSIRGAMGLIDQQEQDFAGDTGLYFSMPERAFAAKVKSISEALDCETEFIDVSTGKTFDLTDLDTTLFGRIKLLGKREFDWQDKEIRPPSLRIGRHVLRIKSDSDPTDDEIMKFCRKRAG